MQANNPLHLRDLRKSYELAALDERDASLSDPLALFQDWLAQALAAQLPEPNAMTLATTGPLGRPSTRVVLVKEVDTQGLVWYTNFESRKGQELAANPWAALQFHWVELERVVRMGVKSEPGNRLARRAASAVGCERSALR
jgi:pyridoxamine 5'-phosphate oxidase